MCKGGSSSSTVDPRIMSMLQSNYSSAQNVANRPYQPYNGQLTADMTPVQNQAGGLLQMAPGMGQNALNAGVNAAQSGANYQAPLIAPPSANAAQMGLGNTYDAPTGNAAQAGPASTASYNPFNAATTGPAAQASAASINPNSISNVGSSNIAGGMGAFTSPYTSQVVNATNAELAQGQQQALMGNAENATEQGAYGGNRLGVQNALTNQQSQLNMGLIDSQLNQAGFNTALQGSSTQAANNLAASQSNAANQLAIQQANAANQQQANLANTSAQNTANLFNAGNQQSANAANAQGLLNAGQFNAGAQNSMAQYNAGNQQQTGLANLGFGNQAAAANAAALNNAAQFNAGNQQQANLFNAGNTLTAAQSNQGAASTAAGINNQAAGLLGSLGQAQNTNFLNGTNALGAYGTQQQATNQNALTAAYQQYLNQLNYPVQMQGLLNSALSGGLGAGTSSPGAQSTAVGGLFGGLGSLGTAATSLIPLL